MAKRDYFLLLDTETTMSDTVADFGAVVVNKKGEILSQCGVLVRGVFGISPLFYIASEDSSQLWSAQGKDRRFDRYNEMLENGSRMMASVAGINAWLAKVQGKYDPILTAYNLPFDVDKCTKTDINLNIFTRRFCLWRASYNKWAMTKNYRNFVLQNHAFNPPTKLGNMSFKTNAEVMARFILGDAELPDEPHTALEDVIGYELPILQRLVKTTSKKQYLESEQSFNWRAVQVRDHFTAN
jgi:hypothetical protein